MKKKVLSIMTAVCLVVSMMTVSAFAANFSDTDDHWAKDEIDRWSSAGVVNGVGNNQFNPNGDMTRAEAAQVFVNLLKLTEKGDISTFTDVPEDAWYADAISICVKSGILNGVGNNQMDPNGTITREQFFVMFARALGIPQEGALNKSVSDADDISDWAAGYVYALINNGYVKGMGNNTVAPANDINRASVMALLDQTVVEYVTEDGTVEVNGDGIVLIVADNVTVTGSGDVTVVVASEDADVSLKGSTGNVAVIALENNVTVTDAPAGTTVTAAENVTGATVNGSPVSSDEPATVPSTPASGGSSGGSSSSGGSGSSGGGTGETTPGTGETTPGTGETTPGTGETTPGTGETTPGTGETTPGTGETTPGTGETTPGTGETTPGTGETTPGTGETTPGTGETTPGTGETTPGTGNGPSSEIPNGSNTDD